MNYYYIVRGTNDNIYDRKAIAAYQNFIHFLFSIEFRATLPYLFSLFIILFFQKIQFSLYFHPFANQFGWISTSANYY